MCERCNVQLQPESHKTDVQARTMGVCTEQVVALWVQIHSLDELHWEVVGKVPPELEAVKGTSQATCQDARRLFFRRN